MSENTKIVMYSRNAALFRDFVRSLSNIAVGLIIIAICVFAFKGFTSVVLDTYMADRITALTEETYAAQTVAAKASGEARHQTEMALFYKEQANKLLKTNNELINAAAISAEERARLSAKLEIEKSKGPVDKLAEEKFVVSTKETLANAKATVVRNTEAMYGKVSQAIKNW